MCEWGDVVIGSIAISMRYLLNLNPHTYVWLYYTVLCTTVSGASSSSNSSSSSSSCSSSGGGGEVRVITGGSDEFLRGYRLTGSADPATTSTSTSSSSSLSKDPSVQKTFLGDEENVLEYFGSLTRTAVVAQQGAIEKCSGLHINSAGTILAAQSTGKVIEVASLSDSISCHVIFYHVI